jgi:tRNA pseudouridine38-40 synthase
MGSRYTGVVPTYRLTVEYDGSRFAGWQVQPRGRTVQGVLIDALREALGEGPIDLQGAGRTDAGVHALAQVASLRCPRAMRPETLLAKLDRLLPGDLAVLDVVMARPGFHARHDAVERSYRYQLALRRSAFGKRYTWWVGAGLALEAMVLAAKSFVGRHDFSALARRAGEAERTVVVVNECSLAAAPGLVLLRIAASHFLWNQVRRMVGALVTVGRGEADPEDVPLWLEGSKPPPALAAPAAGLFLEHVRYRGEERDLPALEPVGVPLQGAVGPVTMAALRGRRRR